MSGTWLVMSDLLKWKEKRQVAAEIKRLEEIKLKPSDDKVNEFIEAHGDNRLKDGIAAADLLKRPYSIIKRWPNSFQHQNRNLIVM